MFEVFAFALLVALVITGFFLTFIKLTNIENLLLKKKANNKSEDK